MSPIPYQHNCTPTISYSCPVITGNGKWDNLSHLFDNVQTGSSGLSTVTQTILLTVTDLWITTLTALPPTQTMTETVFLYGPNQSNISGSSSNSGGNTFWALKPNTTSLAPSFFTTSNASPISASTTATSTPSRKPSPIPGITPPTALPDQSHDTILPTGAAVGVTLASVLFVLLLAICFVRHRLRRKRVNDRTSVTPFVQEKPTFRPSVNQRQQKHMEYLAERWGRMRSLRNRERLGESSRAVAARSSARTRAVKNGQYHKIESNQNRARTNSPLRPPPVARRGASARQPASDTPQVSSLLKYGAVARLEFMPSRPDELLVSPGDDLRVIALYDDGWAFCKNNYGGKGMVPTPCLRINDVRRMR